MSTDEDLDAYAESVAKRIVDRESRLQRLAMLKRQQLENDEEEIQKSAKKQALSKANVISTSNSPVKSSQKQPSVFNYSSPSKNQFLPSFNSTQINTTIPLQSLQSSTNINMNNSINVCSPKPYQKSPGLQKSPIKSPIKPFMCHSPSQGLIASTFTKKVIDFSSNSLSTTTKSNCDLNESVNDDDNSVSTIDQSSIKLSPTKSVISIDNATITPTKPSVSPVKQSKQLNSNQVNYSKSTTEITPTPNSPVCLFSTVKSSNPIKMISPIKQTNVATPETLSLNDKKKLFENAIKEETENAKRVEEQKQFLLRKKFPTNLNQDQTASLPKKIKTSILEFENKFINNESPKSWTTTTKKEPKILDVEMKPAALNQLKEKEVDPIEDKYEEEKEINNYETSSNSLHSIPEDDEAENDSQEEEDTVVLNKKSSGLYPNLSEFKEEKESTSESTLKQQSPIKNIDKETNNITPSINKPQQKENNKTVTPLRTLSQYRREQKQRAALYSTPTNKTTSLNDNQSKEDELTNWQLYKEQLREKLIDLKTLVEKYDKIIAQSSNAITTCLKSNNEKGSQSYQIEAEKILMITTQKKHACLREINLINTKMNSTDHKVPSISAANGCITFEKIQIPLKGDFIVGQISDQDPLNHHFICVAKCGEIVLETELLSSNDSIQDASITFDQNKMQFKELDMEFEIQFEVYGLALPKEKVHHHDKRSLINYHSLIAPLSPKLSRSKKVNANDNKLTYSANDGFTRLGFVKINKSNLLDKKFDLEDFLYNSPFNGQVQIDFKLSADYKVGLKDYLNFYDESGEYPVWNRRWCVLKGYLLAYWRFKEDETVKPSLGVIDLRKCVNKKFGQVNYEICARSNTFMLSTLKEVNDQDLTEKQLRKKQAIDKNKIHKTMAVEKLLISTDMDEDMKEWCNCLNKLLPLIRVWEEDASPILDTY